MTLNAINEVTATDGRLTRMDSCPAVRGSLDLADTAMPTQIDHAGEQRGEQQLGEQVRGLG